MAPSCTIPVRSMRATALVGAALALVACKTEPPTDLLQALPHDSVAVVSVDLERTLAWAPLQHDRGRVLGSALEALVAAADSCDVGLSTGRVTAAWTAETTTLVLSARNVGSSDALSCLAAHEDVVADSGVTIDAHADPAVVTLGATAWTVAASAGDRLDLHRARSDGAPSTEAAGIDPDSPISTALAAVDYGRPIWGVAADGSDAPWGELVDGRDLAMGVTLGDDAELSVTGVSDGVDAAAIAAAVRGAVSRVYLPVSIAERLEIGDDDEHLTIRATVAAAELYALDLRWLDAPAASSPAPSPPTRSADAEALVASWAATSSPAMSIDKEAEHSLILGKFEPVGVAECDDYVRSYGACIEDKIPTEAREVSWKALKVSVEAWRQAATTEAGKKGLAHACRTASEAVRSACA